MINTQIPCMGPVRHEDSSVLYGERSVAHAHTRIHTHTHAHTHTHTHTHTHAHARMRARTSDVASRPLAIRGGRKQRRVWVHLEHGVEPRPLGAQRFDPRAEMRCR